MGVADSEDRCREHRLAVRIDAAFKQGDLEALRAAHDEWRTGTLDSDDAAESSSFTFPNDPGPLWMGHPLVYAIYHSPLSFVRRLLEIGADPNVAVADGFPPLVAAVSSAREQPGHAGRADIAQVLDLLFEFGARPDQRGFNDYTALHWAAGDGNRELVEVLLKHGADPRIRTRIDDCEDAVEVAAASGHADVAARLREAAADLDRRERQGSGGAS